MLKNIGKKAPALAALVLSVALPALMPDAADARPGAKAAFKPAASAGAKAFKPAPRAKAILPGRAAPKVKPLPKPARPGTPKVRPISPGGKPGIKPGLPKPRPLPPRAGKTGPKHEFNKAAKRKPLREIFNPAANPPKKPPAKSDPPPQPVPRPKGPTFKPPGI